MESTEQKSRIILKLVYEAIKENNYEKLNYLLKNGDDDCTKVKELFKLNQVPDKRRNPLNVALKSGSSDKIIKLLLESGADPNEHVLHSPFLLAIRRKDSKSFKLLVEYGGNPLKSTNIILTALKAKYYDEEILKSIAQFGYKEKIKNKRIRYFLLIRALKSGRLVIIESVLSSFQEISRDEYNVYHNSYRSSTNFRGYLKTPIGDLISTFIFENIGHDDNSSLSLSTMNFFQRILQLIKVLYNMMPKEDRQQTVHDFNHEYESFRANWNAYYDDNDDHCESFDGMNLELLEMVIEDLKWDFDINSVAICGDGRQSKQILLVCAFRYRNEVLAERLIKLGADLTQVKFEDLSLIYRLKSRDKLMKLLIAAGFRLAEHFDIQEFIDVTDFGEYVLWTGCFVDYYITDKMEYLYRLYTILVPQYQLSLQSLCRISIIQNFKPYTLKKIIDSLPTKLKEYMSFNDCDE